jgi:hypothetical protein
LIDVLFKMMTAWRTAVADGEAVVEADALGLAVADGRTDRETDELGEGEGVGATLLCVGAGTGCGSADVGEVESSPVSDAMPNTARITSTASAHPMAT